MARTEIGTLTYEVKALTIETDDKEGVLTEVRTCDWDDRGTYTPDIGDSHGDYSNYSLKQASQERVKGGLCEITLVYRSLAPNQSGGAGLPATQYSESVGQIEVDIRLHPDFATFAGWDEERGEFDSSSDKYGVRSFIRPVAIITKTEFFNTEPSSNYTKVGKLEAPGGGYTGSNNWLVTGTNKSQYGEYWVKQTTYMYAPDEWDTDIYEAA